MTLYLQKIKANGSSYLRNIFTSFDNEFRGIYTPLNHDIRIDLDNYKNDSVEVKRILVKERADGNLIINPCLLESEVIIAKNRVIKIDSNFKSNYFTHMLICDNRSVSALVAHSSSDIFVRELLLMQDIDKKMREIDTQYDEFILWCAGVRSKLMLEKTYLSNLKIKAVIDSNTSNAGKLFNGIKITSPDEAKNFNGAIIICHATNPYPIEKYIIDNQFKATGTYII